MASEYAVKPCLHNSVSQVDLSVFLIFCPGTATAALECSMALQVEKSLSRKCFYNTVLFVLQVFKNGNRPAVFFTLEQLLAPHYLCFWLSAEWWGPRGCDSQLRRKANPSTQNVAFCLQHIFQRSFQGEWEMRNKQVENEWSAYFHVMLYTVAFMSCILLVFIVYY